jgi:hypothetical protein
VPARKALLTAVAGKGVERGLDPEWMEDGTVFLRYTTPQDERQDNLHKQSIRSLVQRIAPDWKIHIQSGEGGFSVEVRPAVLVDKEIDLDNAKQMEELAEQLEQLSITLRELVLA